MPAPPANQPPLQTIPEMIERIPCLARRTELKPFDAYAMDEWASGPASPGERIAASFVLGVWDRHEPWKVGRFDVIEAFGRCDEKTRAVISEWAADPFTL